MSEERKEGHSQEALDKLISYCVAEPSLKESLSATVYAADISAIILDKNLKIDNLTKLAENRIGYGLRETKMSGLTMVKRKLDEVIRDYAQRGETEITNIKEIVIDTRDRLKLHIKPYIRIVDNGAIVIIEKAYKINPRAILRKLFGACKQGDVYLEAPRVLDHHALPGQSPEEEQRIKKQLEETVRACLKGCELPADEKGRTVLGIGYTEHISRACINLFNTLAPGDSLFLYNPWKDVHEKLIAQKFPEKAILLEPVNSAAA